MTASFEVSDFLAVLLIWQTPFVASRPLIRLSFKLVFGRVPRIQSPNVETV